MGFLDPGISDRFRDLPDGRLLFLPRGTRGPAYEIRDWRMRDRIERWYKITTIARRLLIFVIGPVVFANADRWWLIVSVFLPDLVDWLIARNAIEGLNEVTEAQQLVDEQQRKKTWDREYAFERSGSSVSSSSRWPLARQVRSLLGAREPS